MTIEKLGRLLPSHSTNYLRFLSKAIMPTRATLIEPSAPTMDKFADVFVPSAFFVSSFDCSVCAGVVGSCGLSSTGFSGLFSFSISTSTTLLVPYATVVWMVSIPVTETYPSGISSEMSKSAS